MKKTIFRIILMSVFIIAVAAIKSNATSDFTYTLTGDLATITGYNGTDSNIIIPSEIDGYTVIKIGSHAFDGRTTNGKNLVSVTISEGITTIDAFAFMQCENIESVILPDSINSIGMQSFIGCTNLTNINIPKSLTIITDNCFAETGLREIIIPDNVTKLQSGAFARMYKVKKGYSI